MPIHGAMQHITSVAQHGTTRYDSNNVIIYAVSSRNETKGKKTQLEFGCEQSKKKTMGKKRPNVFRRREE